MLTQKCIANVHALARRAGAMDPRMRVRRRVVSNHAQHSTAMHSPPEFAASDDEVGSVGGAVEGGDARLAGRDAVLIVCCLRFASWQRLVALICSAYMWHTDATHSTSSALHCWVG